MFLRILRLLRWRGCLCSFLFSAFTVNFLHGATIKIVLWVSVLSMLAFYSNLYRTYMFLLVVSIIKLKTVNTLLTIFGFIASKIKN